MPDSAVLSDGQTHTSTNLAQATQTFNVTVTDDKPTITAFDFANGEALAENSANGTVIGTVAASDPNVGDSLTYALSNNANGAFAIDGLPPGEQYLALATDYLDSGEHLDPEFLSAIRNAAVPFTLADSEMRTLELTVVER